MFYLRRILRIVPMYFFALAIFIAILGLTSASLPSNASIISHLTFANIIDIRHSNDILEVEWSIATEVSFYLLFPLIVFVARKGVWIVLLGILLIVTPTAREALFRWMTGPDFGFRQFTLPWHFYAFLSGILAFQLVRKRAFMQALSKRANIICLAPAAVIIAHQMYVGETMWSGPSFAIATMLVILNCEAGGLARKVLSQRHITAVGVISFSVYLLHLTFIMYFGPWLALPAVIAASVVTYKVIEKPFMDLGRRISRERIRQYSA